MSTRDHDMRRAGGRSRLIGARAFAISLSILDEGMSTSGPISTMAHTLVAGSLRNLSPVTHAFAILGFAQRASSMGLGSNVSLLVIYIDYQHLRVHETVSRT